MGLNSRTSLKEENLKWDNEDGQRADVKFKFSWIFSDKSGGGGSGDSRKLKN